MISIYQLIFSLDLLYCVAAAPLGYYLGTKIRDWRYAINKENMAIYKVGLILNTHKSLPTYLF